MAKKYAQRDKNGRFVKKTISADQILQEQLAKKKREEREAEERRLAETAAENPEALCEDAEPMQFETPEDGVHPADEGTGLAIAVAFFIVAITFIVGAFFVAKWLAA